MAEDGKSRQMASGKAKGKCLERKKRGAKPDRQDFPLFELLRQLPVNTGIRSNSTADGGSASITSRQRWRSDNTHVILSRSAVCVPDFRSENYEKRGGLNHPRALGNEPADAEFVSCSNF
ncbi:MAG: hypothetical protein ACLR8P_08755 [Clostridium fessum]